MNDVERKLWVQNDEGLYNWWRDSKLNLAAFVKEHREELTRVITSARDAKPRK